MSTLLAVPLTVHSPDAALADAELAKGHGADLVEFRLDGFVEDEPSLIAALGLIADSPLPCIATCRPVWEGGEYEGDEELRLDLFERLIGADRPPRHIDIEFGAFDRTPGLAERLRSALGEAGDRAPRLIVSIHDFEQRPADLTRRLMRLRELDIARIHKIAFRARSLRDNLELFDLLAQRDRPMIALGMGEFGLMSRILAPKFGGHLTFASLRDTSTTAPGQPTIRELLDLYRLRSISPGTAVYGVVGWPVSHSLSPHVHNAAFEHAGMDAVYLPMPVAGADDPGQTYASLKATVLDLLGSASLNLRGLSVTIPYKEHLVALAREHARAERPWRLDGVSDRTGAANTLTVLDHEIEISNTDGAAAISALRNAGVDPGGSRIVVVGAGGAGRTLAIALADEGAHVLLANRTLERAARVAADAAALDPGPAGRVEAVAQDAIPGDADAYVNATSLGMASGENPDESALAIDFIRRLPLGTVLFDTVYRDSATPLLEAGARRGLRCVDGIEMFVRQASAQFSGWTGRPAPGALIERVARERLGG